MATARILRFTEEDLEGVGGGAYAELEVPCDAPVRLVEVLDYDKRDQGKSWGWIFKYMATTPSGKEVEFRTYLSFSDKARWKLTEVLSAHGVDLQADDNEVDPEDLIGDELMGHIDFPRNRETGEPTSEFRELQKVFPYETDAPYAEDIPAIEDYQDESQSDDEPEVL